jgi:uncharacterized phiE125 gp8 family phage protein
MSLLSINLVTPPVVEPVTVTQLKQSLRIDAGYTDEDDLLSGYISGAREWCESYMRRAIYNQTWQLTLDHFPYWTEGTTLRPSNRLDYMYGAYMDDLCIELPKPKLVSVTSITYIDATGTPQTLASSNYNVDVTSEPARITPAQGTFWPTSQQYIPGSVKITYVAGTYGDGVTINTCPSSIAIAISLMAGHLNEHRESTSVSTLSEVPFGVKAFLNMYRHQCVGYSQSY